MPLNISIDVDGTLLGDDGNPIHQAHEKLLQLKTNGHRLQLWSTGGADYAKTVAVKHKLTDLFESYGTKPDVAIDDIPESVRPVSILKTDKTFCLTKAIEALESVVESNVESFFCPSRPLVNYVANIQNRLEVAKQNYGPILRDSTPFHPIPFFGNLSGARVITIGLNPSSGEFEPWRNWPSGEIDSDELALRLVNYFRLPYTLPHPWFSDLLEAMNIINCPYSLFAAHIDASPWPTLSPKSLKKKSKPELLALYGEMIRVEAEHIPRTLRRCQHLKLAIIVGSKEWMEPIGEIVHRSFCGRVEIIEKSKLPAWVWHHKDDLRQLVKLPATVS